MKFTTIATNFNDEDVMLPSGNYKVKEFQFSDIRRGIIALVKLVYLKDSKECAVRLDYGKGITIDSLESDFGLPDLTKEDSGAIFDIYCSITDAMEKC